MSSGMLSHTCAPLHAIELCKPGLKGSNPWKQDLPRVLGTKRCCKVDDLSFLGMFYRSFHVYQHVTSFSNMRAHWLAERTNAVCFRTQNMFNVWAKTLEYSSKYTNILNPNVREDRPGVRWQLWQIVRFVLGSRKPQNELLVGRLFGQSCWYTGRLCLVTKY